MRQAALTKNSSPQLVQARALETRARIIEVALSTFAELGYEGANTRDIADEAGATHGAIRYHFGTKEALWKTAIECMFQRLYEEVYGEGRDELMNIEDPAEALREFLARYIVYSAKNPDHARIMISESIRGGERLEWMVDTFIRPSHEILFKRLKKMSASGILPDLPPVSLFYLIVSMCQLPFVLSKEIKLLHGVDVRKNASIKEHINTVTSLLIK